MRYGFDGIPVGPLWNNKLWQVNEFSIVNPFHSDHFLWVDIGYFQ